MKSKKSHFPEFVRGMPIFYNTGELSFETNPHEAGTFKCIFLEEVNDYVKILNKNGNLQMVHYTLISRFNI
jgi:hypothetical protein